MINESYNLWISIPALLILFTAIGFIIYAWCKEGKEDDKKIHMSSRSKK